MDGLFKVFEISGKRILFDGETLDFYILNAPSKIEAYTDFLRKSRPVSDNIKQTQDGHYKISNVLVNIANLCNIRCQYCSAKGGNYGRNSLMDIETAKQIQKRLSSFERIGGFTFFGGEPTLNFAIIQDFYDCLCEKVNKFCLITNGVAIPLEQLRFYNENNISMIISIDGDERIHNKVRMKYKNVERTIFQIVNEFPNIKLKLVAQYTPLHIKESISLVDLHKFFKSRFGNIPYMISYVFSENPSLKFSRSDMRKIKEEWRKEVSKTFEYLRGNRESGFYSKSVTRMLLDLVLKRKSAFFCTKCTSGNLNFDVDGTLYPCHVFFGRNEYACHHKENLIEKVNAKESYKRCRFCWAKYICKRCPGTIMVEFSEDIFINDQKCYLEEIIKSTIVELLKLVIVSRDEYYTFVKNLKDVYHQVHEV